MSKCPHCKKEINYLKFERDVKQWGNINVDEDGNLEYLTDQPYDEITNYFCPSCDTAIECDPEEFLKRKIITSHDFKYPETLRLDFDVPIGISSYGFEKEEALKQFNTEYPGANANVYYSFETLLKCNKLGKKINNILIKSLRKYRITKEVMILDWRDELELEIHNIDQDKFEDSVIQEINFKLKELLGE